MLCPASGTGEVESSSLAALQANSYVDGNFNGGSGVLTIQAINGNGLTTGALLTVTNFGGAVGLQGFYRFAITP